MKLKIVKSGGFQGMLLEKEVDMNGMDEADQQMFIAFVKKRAVSKPNGGARDQFQYHLTLDNEEISFGEFDLTPEDAPLHQKLEDMLKG